MCRENLDAVRGVRTSVNVPRKSQRRSLDERIFVRFPGLVRVLASAWSRLPPQSRLRRAFLSHVMGRGFAAANRRDFDVVVLSFDPEFEFHIADSPAARFLPPDLLGVHRGPEGYRRVWEMGLEALDYKIYCEEIIDLGDRLFVVGRQVGRGKSSGISLDLPLYQLYTLRRGLPIRQVDFSDANEALEAVGLPGVAMTSFASRLAGPS
jgi:hypothetical protein